MPPGKMNPSMSKQGFRKIQLVNAHTGGEPARAVIAAGPGLPAKTAPFRRGMR